MLHPWTIIPVLLFAAAEVIWGYPQARVKASAPDPSVAVPYAVGRMVGGMILPLAIAAAVWFPSRSRLASSLVFACALLMVAAFTVVRAPLVQRRATAKPVTDVAATIRQKTAAADAARNAVIASGTLDRIEELTSVDEIERRLRLLEAGRQATRELIAAGDNVGATLRDAMAGAGVGSRVAGQQASSFEAGFDWPSKRPHSNERVAAASRRVLRRNGRWIERSARSCSRTTAR